jgi:hypothetical protein
MKIFYQLIAATLLSCSISMTGFAADQTVTNETQPQKPPMPMKGMGMGNMTEEQQEQHLKMAQENMLMMHDLSSKILAEKDPAKQEQLKKQQRDLMKAHHAAMMGTHHHGMK